MSFVFYDTETTGTHTAYDQIVQFAAIRTDDRLNELDRFEVRCRLLPYVVPSIGAMLVNRTTARDLTDETRPSHYEMVGSIRKKLLSWSPTMFVGFNSIGFDEHILRQEFYRTLHPIYVTNTGGNTRADAMRLLHAASLFAPNTIAVPTSGADRLTFRLDRLASANGFDHVNAHDATGDVEATIHLCRLLLTRAPALWSSAIRLSRKSAILDFVETEPAFCLTDFYFGRPFTRIVSAIGHNEQNTSELYIYNLTFPLEYIAGLGEHRLRQRLPGRPKPVDTMRANAAPILTRLEQAPISAQGITVGLDELRRRAEALRADVALRERLIAAFEGVRRRWEPSAHVEQQIYERFVSDADESRMETFHVIPWSDRRALIDEFEDARLRELGLRLIYCERPDLLDEGERQTQANLLSRRLLGLDGDVPWLTLRDAIQGTTDVLQSAKAADLDLVREHRDQLQSRLAQAMRIIA